MDLDNNIMRGPPPLFLGNRVSASCPVQNRRRAPCFPLEPASVSPPGSAYKKRPSSLPPLASPRSRRLTCTVPTEITTRTEQEPHEPSPSAGWRRRWRAGRRRRWWWRRAWARWRRSRTRRACAAGTTRCIHSSICCRTSSGNPTRLTSTNRSSFLCW